MILKYHLFSSGWCENFISLQKRLKMDLKNINENRFGERLAKIIRYVTQHDDDDDDQLCSL